MTLPRRLVQLVTFLVVCGLLQSHRLSALLLPTADGHSRGWPFDPAVYDPNDIILVSYLTHMPQPSTRQEKNILNFLLSAKRVGFRRVVLIGFGLEERSKMNGAVFSMQMHIALRTMLRIDPRQVVIFADLFDIIWLGPMSEHLRRYKQYFVEDGAATGGYVPGEEGRRWPVVVQGDKAALCRPDGYDQYWKETFEAQCKQTALYRCTGKETVHDLVAATELLPYPNTGHYTARLGELLPVVANLLAGHNDGLDQGWACRNAVAQLKLPLRGGYPSYLLDYATNESDANVKAAVTATKGLYPSNPVVVDGHGILSLNANTGWLSGKSTDPLPRRFLARNSVLGTHLARLDCRNTLMRNKTKHKKERREYECTMNDKRRSAEPEVHVSTARSVVAHLSPLSIHLSGGAKYFLQFLERTAFVAGLYNSHKEPWGVLLVHAHPRIKVEQLIVSTKRGATWQSFQLERTGLPRKHVSRN